MRTWEKPELIVEEFELDQHVAAGCDKDTTIIVKPGESITVGYGCHSSYPGKGHWHAQVEIKDDNKNGKIDYAEMVKYLENADNGIQTGQGHENHAASVKLPGGDEYWVTQKPFTS